jgi:hypothetical protein
VTLWIDALCINQKDTPEKELQIQLLRHMYQRADATLAMLNGAKGSDAAVEMLMGLNTTPMRSGSEGGEGEETRSLQSTTPCGPVSPLSSTTSGSDVPGSSKKQWCLRWCGPSARPTPSTGATSSPPCAACPNTPPSPHPSLTAWLPFHKLAICRMHEAQQKRWGILSLLEAFRDARSSLARDKSSRCWESPRMETCPTSHRTIPARLRRLSSADAWHRVN